MASVHSHDMLQFLNQTGPNPPKIMEAEVSGKYIDENNNSKKIKGQIRITEWIRSVKSQDPGLYPPTNTWYPQKWEFRFGEDIPEDIRDFVMIPIVSGGQSGFFGNGLHYSEGAVYLKDNEGNSLGEVLLNQQATQTQ